ncbi:hypothetical protein ABZ470_39950 [Streptosporangium sp. NPDC020072]|uniref:hypothetical protein n=1 Tax=Streptosporangium sp. NPDC020072 TaxID=3154788 RepID=UPI00342BF56B
MINVRQNAARVIRDIATTYDELMSWLGHRSPIVLDETGPIPVLVINHGKCNGQAATISANAYQMAHQELHLAAAATSWLACPTTDLDTMTVITGEITQHLMQIKECNEALRTAVLEAHGL